MALTPLADLLQLFLMYVVAPTWLVAGLADWACHRASHIEQTSGVKESALHLLQFVEVGLPLLAVLALEVNALILLTIVAGLALHQASAIWDVRYANATRTVSPAEQHVHGVLEAIPAVAVAIVSMLHWPEVVAMLEGSGRFALAWKHPPLPGWYQAGLIAGVTLLGILPYGEELLRTSRAAHAARKSMEGRAIISQKIASTAPKGGKPKTNQRRNRR